MTPEQQQFELEKLRRQQEFEAAKAEDERSHKDAQLARTQMLEASREYARQVHALAVQYEAHMKEYAIMALRSLFIANGGAIVATFTLIGSSLGKTGAFQTREFVIPLICYAAGAASAVVSMLFAYMNYGLHKHSQATPGALANMMISPEENWPNSVTDRMAKGVKRTYYVSFGSGLLSILAFVAGCVVLAHTFSADRVQRDAPPAAISIPVDTASPSTPPAAK